MLRSGILEGQDRSVTPFSELVCESCQRNMPLGVFSPDLTGQTPESVMVLPHLGQGLKRQTVHYFTLHRSFGSAAEAVAVLSFLGNAPASSKIARLAALSTSGPVNGSNEPTRHPVVSEIIRTAGLKAIPWFKPDIGCEVRSPGSAIRLPLCPAAPIREFGGVHVPQRRCDRLMIGGLRVPAHAATVRNLRAFGTHAGRTHRIYLFPSAVSPSPRSFGTSLVDQSGLGCIGEEHQPRATDDDHTKCHAASN